MNMFFELNYPKNNCFLSLFPVVVTFSIHSTYYDCLIASGILIGAMFLSDVVNIS